MYYNSNLVFTTGTYRFDLHPGHRDFLERAAKIGRLIVFLDTKDRVQTLKPWSFCYDDDIRKKQLLDNKNVADVQLFSNEEELKKKMTAIWKQWSEQCRASYIYSSSPNLFFAKGSDYTFEQLTMKPFIDSLGGTCVLIPLLPGYSTTKNIKRMQGQK